MAACASRCTSPPSMSTANDDSLAAVSPTAKRAHDSSLAPEARTVQKKKQALSLASHVDGRSEHIFSSCSEHDGVLSCTKQTTEQKIRRGCVGCRRSHLRNFCCCSQDRAQHLPLCRVGQRACGSRRVLLDATISPLFFWRVLPSTYSTGLQKPLLLGHPNVCVAFCMSIGVSAWL